MPCVVVGKCLGESIILTGFIAEVSKELQVIAVTGSRSDQAKRTAAAKAGEEHRTSLYFAASLAGRVNCWLSKSSESVFSQLLSRFDLQIRQAAGSNITYFFLRGERFSLMSAAVFCQTGYA